MAFRALSRGECERALVGAASLSYLAELAVHYDDLGWLSASGSCKPFDKAGKFAQPNFILFLKKNCAVKEVEEFFHEFLETLSTFSPPRHVSR